ncbi:MAG: glycosyltransferase family 4 protein [Planctomycetes bacterium]|nr:glycosyltransferase family 4 protein [Planctomycetota bacterium]
MRGLFLTFGPDTVASTRVRILTYLPLLREAGIETSVITTSTILPYYLAMWRTNNLLSRGMRYGIGLTTRCIKTPYLWGQALRAVVIANRFDIVFIQKVLLPIPIQRLLHRRNPRIIFDFDDALFARTRTYGPESWLIHQLETSSLILAGNEYLANYARQYAERVDVIPTSVDVNRYRPLLEPYQGDDCLVIGWIGGPSTLEQLETLGPVFQELAANYSDIEVRVVGTTRTSLDRLLPTVCKSWRFETEVADLQNFDIGVMPLVDDRWTRGKCGYKLLQYMATGIPSVASPVGVNAEIIDHGVNGLLASTPDEWRKSLEVLVQNQALRNKLGAAGRKKVVAEYSVEAHLPKLKQVLFDVSGL